MVPIIPLVVGAGLVLALVMGAKASNAASATPALPPGPAPGPSTDAPAGAAPATSGSAPAGALPAGTVANTGSTAVAHADDSFDAAVAAAIAAHDIPALQALAAKADAMGLHTVANSIREEIALLQGTAPPPPTTTPDAPHPTAVLATYITQKGDTGTSVAKKFTGDGNRWRELLTVNPTLKDSKYGIKWNVGQRINLPSSWPSGVPVLSPAPVPVTTSPVSTSWGAAPAPVVIPPAAPSGVHTYRVVSGDTGEKVATKFVGDKNRWRELLTVNPTLKDAKYGIKLYTGHDINIPANWPAVPSGGITPLALPGTSPVPIATAPIALPGGAPPQSDIVVAAQELTNYLTSIGGLAGRGKESRARVASWLARLGVPDPTGMYGRQGATAVMQVGLVPVVPYYWPKTGATAAKADFSRLVQNYAAADTQRAPQWQKLLSDIQRA